MVDGHANLHLPKRTAKVYSALALSHAITDSSRLSAIIQLQTAQLFRSIGSKTVIENETEFAYYEQQL